MFDLIVKNATLPDGTRGIDIGCKKGVIAAIEQNLPRPASRLKQTDTSCHRPLSIRIFIWMRHFH